MAKKQIITDRDITEAWKRGSKTITINDETLITPQAKDSAKFKKIVFIKSETGLDINNEKCDTFLLRKIAIGSDHGGFRLKEIIKKFLMDKNISIIDMGTNSEQPCDYPDFAFAVGMAVKQNQADMGIMIDGVGVASAMVANKIPGIRAACCSDEFSARSSREHNNAQILTFGSKVIGQELAKSIVMSFLSAKFLGDKHLKRIEKIRDIENKFSK
jgi:ribose 5-phosphate isomerase B